MKGWIFMGRKSDDNNNGFAISDEKMDFLIKESVRLELERQKVLGLKLETLDDCELLGY